MVTAASMVDNSSGLARGVRPPMDTHTPSFWGNIFADFSLDDQVHEMYVEAIEALKEEARSMLMAATSHKLIVLIDTFERLGLAYHFDTEIEQKLTEVYNHHANAGDEDEDCDLSITALRFRLLRQHQYHVSCGMFDKYMDQENKFKESLANDVEGLLSLYEAAQVLVHGEHILEEALVFTAHHLSHLGPQLEPTLNDRVKQALELSLHRGIPVILVRRYISIYERDEKRAELLLKLAKLNFNFLQNLYKKELSELTRWWNKFDLKSKLPYMRDRVTECYIWGLALHFEPQYNYVRLGAAKSMQMAAILNDTYDNYATIEEAQLFTEILERLEMDGIDRLPDYMKNVYGFIMSICEEYERDATKQGMSFAIPYFKEAVKQLGRAYNEKLEWLVEGKIPLYEDYFTHSLVTSCIYVMFTAGVIGLKSVTKQSLDWMLTQPKFVTSTATIGRILDDLASHDRENKGGELLTVVDYYMKYYGMPQKETLLAMSKLVDDSWKDLNTEWVANTSDVPADLAVQFLNYARATDVTYKNGVDGFTNPEKMIPLIIALLKDPLVI